MIASLEFTQPWALALIPLPLLVRVLLPPHRESQDSLQVPYFQRLVRLTGETPRQGASIRRRRRAQSVTSVLGWFLLVAACARPEWIGAPVTIEKTARDLMLALDLSGSMAAEDFMDPVGERQDRLRAAKAVLEAFAREREGDRLGLIVFGNAAYLQAPFTADLDTWQTLLDETEVAMAGQSTALGDAIGLAIALFRESATKNRVLVVLTDGNDTGSRVPPIDAAAIAAANDVVIYTVAVGDPATVGEEALDLATLEAVTAATGGRSFTAGDWNALQQAYGVIDNLEPARYDVLSYRPRSSLFHWPLAAFAVLYLVALPVFALVGRREKRAIGA